MGRDVACDAASADGFVRQHLNGLIIQSVDHTQSPGFAIPPQVAKELATRSETVVPGWAALLTLLKYRGGHNYTNPGWLGPRIADKLLVRCAALQHSVRHGRRVTRPRLLTRSWCTSSHTRAAACTSDDASPLVPSPPSRQRSLIMLTLYLNMGKNFASDNLTNIVSCLFMWALLPAFGAASYVPAIVLGAWRVGTHNHTPMHTSPPLRASRPRLRTAS
jgi:hypothetical protein